MTPDELRLAAHILDAEAESLRRCNTDASGEWVLYYEGQADREAHDEMRALAAKLRAMADASSAPSGWQPIETAPRDGTRVLLREKFGHFEYVGRWMDPGPDGADAMWADPDGEYQIYPNLWHPLPPPPEAK